MVVPSCQDDSTVLGDLARAGLHHLAKLLIERLVHLVEQEDLGLRVGDSGETQAGAHALRIGRYRAVEGLCQAALGLQLGQQSPRTVTR